MTTPLDPEQIRSLIYERARVLNESCNRRHRAQTSGVVRGLIWALTGSDPGDLANADIRRILEAASIPFTQISDDTVEIPNEWLRDHGFMTSAS